MAMLQLEKEFPFSDQELESIKDLCDSLKPVEVAVKYICKVRVFLLLFSFMTLITKCQRKIIDVYSF